ncbi:prolipoprotein diacylglyceryl transferase [Paenibacillus sp. VTT E-133280]|uniref:prolipoprotein diacylglyceryl transferase n=1 Tax=unclassified Paenibacillus TaxID=185978 RepID=UPI000BA086A8|nr:MULTISPECIES: prolipoprotein diacylglyceryl transferase [unclassified Paenibacillus]MBY3621385.1 prolipoprotein diacylglyceryl transferase [Acinetobacter sp. CUI P1]MDH6373004.1 phosphatidylglycerol:prolipoprotein diacylglycerol transferase [Paenibacillus sp. PastF-3]OZQ60340.1 prolipoprotein diacylglyceryl transferase [Paenibacillus sp. VTT E-133280]OZQ85089.1 prolipoprotein diacylglyceryl transferase [Paenibacillus sp. VTT E-133291]
MRVELFEIGGFTIRSYGVVVTLAVLAAVGVALYIARDTSFREHIPNLMIYVIGGAILGARIWHVFFFQWDYFSMHPSEIIAIWNGGISIQGALIGGSVTAAAYARIHRISFWELADMLAPAIILGQAIGRIACFLNGDAFGSPTNAGFGVVYPEGTLAYEQYGAVPLWPAEVWEGQWDFVVFAILLSLKNKKLPRGVLFLSYNILYAAGRFLLEYLRGDSPRYALDWTAGQWTSVSVMSVALVLMVYFIRKQRLDTPITSGTAG